MGFSEAIHRVFIRKYATFSGRAPRSEFWWFTLFYFAVFFILLLILLALGAQDVSASGQMPMSATLLIVVTGIFALASLVPLLAVTVRRLHDRNFSGWWYLGAIVAGFLPVVGWIASIALLVVCALPGTAGPNRFGADPLGGPDLPPSY